MLVPHIFVVLLFHSKGHFYNWKILFFVFLFLFFFQVEMMFLGTPKSETKCFREKPFLSSLRALSWIFKYLSECWCLAAEMVAIKLMFEVDFCWKKKKNEFNSSTHTNYLTVQIKERKYAQGQKKLFKIWRFELTGCHLKSFKKYSVLEKLFE